MSADGSDREMPRRTHDWITRSLLTQRMDAYSFRASIGTVPGTVICVIRAENRNSGTAARPEIKNSRKINGRDDRI